MRFLGAGVTGICGPPSMGVRNQTPGFCKSKRCSELLSLHSVSKQDLVTKVSPLQLHWNPRSHSVLAWPVTSCFIPEEQDP